MTLFLARSQSKQFISLKKAKCDIVGSYNYDWQADEAKNATIPSVGEKFRYELTTVITE